MNFAPMLLARRHRLFFFFGAVALLLLGIGSAQARADEHDIVQFGNDIVVHSGEEAHDVVCFLCSIEVDGTAQGSAVAFLGNVQVRGHADHDVVVFAGNVTVADGASIEEDVVVFAGRLRVGNGATIGKDRVVFPTFIFILPLLVIAGFVALIIWAIRSLLSRNRPPYPMPPPRR